jgi:tRNA-2-methylthio-N6-dimethylallyladenosine synthase
MATVRAMSGPLGLRYHVMTFGCQMNENDSEKLAGMLEEMGYVQGSGSEDADLVVVNTCSVRENADGRFYGNLGILRSIREKTRPGMIVALCGCMMKQSTVVDRIRRSHSFVDLVFGPSDLHRFPEMLYRRLTEERRIYEVGTEDPIAEGLPIVRGFRYRALSTIMYGCDNFCTYCIVPYVRGRERSRPMEAVLTELRGIAAEGFREVLLLGQNVNAYGKDLEEGDFATLLEETARIPGIRRIRFMTSHPRDMSLHLLDVMSSYPTICPHLHLPLQSGSDEILRRMNRGYDRGEYLRLVKEARARMPGIALSTDLIVGFPGETEADFAETLDLMDRVRFDSAFTFQYSIRPGTPAATMEGQIDPKTVTERFGRLVEMQNEHCLASNRSIEGTLQEVLVEGRDAAGTGRCSGRTPHNRLVHFQSPNGPEGADAVLPEGTLVRVLVKKAHSFSLEAEWKETLP